eukprot:gene14024-16528_t
MLIPAIESKNRLAWRKKISNFKDVLLSTKNELSFQSRREDYIRLSNAYNDFYHDQPFVRKIKFDDDFPVSSSEVYAYLTRHSLSTKKRESKKFK